MLLERCTSGLLIDGRVVPLTVEARASILRAVAAMGGGGLRVLAYALKEGGGLGPLRGYDGSPGHAGAGLIANPLMHETIESDLTLVGWVRVPIPYSCSPSSLLNSSGLVIACPLASHCSLALPFLWTAPPTSPPSPPPPPRRGQVGLLDPLRPGILSAITSLSEAGVRVVLVSGDAKPTAEAIARQAGVALRVRAGGLYPGEGWGGVGLAVT